MCLLYLSIETSEIFKVTYLVQNRYLPNYAYFDIGLTQYVLPRPFASVIGFLVDKYNIGISRSQSSHYDNLIQNYQ